MFTWTTEKPDKPGFYWCRLASGLIATDPTIVKFHEPSDYLGLSETWLNPQLEDSFIDRWCSTDWAVWLYEWAGPIEVPNEME